MLAGTLAAVGLDLLAILASPSPRAPPGAFILAASLIATVGLVWLADEIADGFTGFSTTGEKPVVSRNLFGEMRAQRGFDHAANFCRQRIASRWKDTPDQV
jgi:hypothetical protein